MPTATLAVEWKRETSQPKELTEEKEQIAAWRDDSGRVAKVDRGLESEIERAKEVLGLQHERSSGDALYSEDTLLRSIEFLTKQNEWLWRSCGLALPVPTIGVGPSGSVDLYWKQPTKQLLVNIPAEANALATFFGNSGIQKVRGSFDPKKLQYSIATWLTM
jgi:hypothetical protein